MGLRRLLVLVLATACGGASDGGDGTGESSGSSAGTTASTSSATTSSSTSSGNESSSSTAASSESTSDSSGSESTGGADGPSRVYVGSYAGSIYVFELDLTDGSLVAIGDPVDAGPSPSFLAVDPQHAFLFAVNEVQSGAVASLAIDPQDGTLTWIDSQDSGGAGPAFVTTDRNGAFVLVAHYGGGSVAVLPVGGDGSLAAPVDVESFGGQALSHAIRTDPSNAWAFVPNKGFDAVAQLAFDEASGELVANTPPSIDTAVGAGPRHLDFHPTLDRIYVIDELDDTMSVYALDPDNGLLTELQVVDTLPMGVDGNANICADVHVHPNGQWLYGSNRGHDSIAIFAIDAGDGTLTPLGHQPTGGSTPRNFTIDPGGELMLVGNQDSDTVVAFAIDPRTGGLTATGATTDVPSPAFVGIVHLP